MDASDKQIREDLLQKLVDARLMGATSQLANQCPDLLPMRVLPHGNFANVFVLYMAFARSIGEEPAGKTLFYQIAQEWKKCLRFHKKTVHAQCAICAKLKSKIQNAREPCFKTGQLVGVS